MALSLARRAPVLLRTDVASFYPSVTPDALCEALRGVGVGGEDARLGAAMLEGWGSGGYPGLPVGPPASGVLANALLAPVDRSLAPLPWLRWVDDYLIRLPSERAAGELLDRLDGALDRLGLRRSEQKTALLDPEGPFRWLGSGPADLARPDPVDERRATRGG